MENIKAHFLRNVNVGIVLSYKELLQFVKKQRLKNVDLGKLKRIRRFWKFTAMFEQPRKKPIYMSQSILKFGCLMCDLGFIPSYKSDNRGFTIFLAVKEMLSGTIGAIELKNKTSDSLFEGLKSVLSKGNFKQVHTLIWDRERSIYNATFIEKAKKELNVNIFFLKARNKAWAAERLIRYIKRQIGLKIQASKSKRWTGHILQNIINTYNNRYYPGTKFRRYKISRSNAFKFLQQKIGSKNPTLTFNTSTLIPAAIYRRDWLAKVFKYSVGDLVLVLKRGLLPDDKEQKVATNKRNYNYDQSYKPYHRKSKDNLTYSKPSLFGAYSKESYVIKSRVLKSNYKWFWTAIYELENRKGFFYEKYACIYTLGDYIVLLITIFPFYFSSELLALED